MASHQQLRGPVHFVRVKHHRHPPGAARLERERRAAMRPDALLRGFAIPVGTVLA